jgi:oligopeptide transport system ATP-binding protein
MEKILEVKGLRVSFDTPTGRIYAVNGVSFSLGRGETLGVVGESGCGKSVSMYSLIRQVPKPGSFQAESILLDGQELTRLDDEGMRRVKGRTIAMIFQNPMTALNPVLPIGFQIEESLIFHMKLSRAQAREQALRLLEQVGIPAAKEHINSYPHQFSGGMLQRVMIACGIACDPKVLIADEPTTALDVTIQAQIVELVKRMRRENNASIIWITHDLSVIAGLADRIIIMYAGFIVEEAPIDEVYERPAHPYTRGLLASLPRLTGSRDERLHSIEGMPPGLYAPPSQCPFLPRCDRRDKRCGEAVPVLEEIRPGHRAACFYAER